MSGAQVTTDDGLVLDAEVHGPADAPLTVLLSHCWTGDREEWRHQVTTLLDRYPAGVRVVAWDHRGHGRSQASTEDGCTIAGLARDLGSVVDALAAPGPLVAVGHSIGAMTLMALPEVRPDVAERVAGLLLVSTSGGGLERVDLGVDGVGGLLADAIPRVLAWRARLLAREDRRRSPSIERLVVDRLLFGRPLRLRDAGLVVDQLVSCPPATMSGFYRDLMRHDRLDGLAGAYAEVPVTVLVGSADRLTPPGHARRLQRALPQARLLVAPGAGHMLPLERPELVSEQLAELVELVELSERVERVVPAQAARRPPTSTTPSSTRTS